MALHVRICLVLHFLELAGPESESSLKQYLVELAYVPLLRLLSFMNTILVYRNVFKPDKSILESALDFSDKSIVNGSKNLSAIVRKRLPWQKRERPALSVPHPYRRPKKW